MQKKNTGKMLYKLNSDLQEKLNKLRPDIKEYLFKIMPIKMNEKRPAEIYEHHKKNISHLCGWDSEKDKYNQNQYDDAISLMIKILGSDRLF